jgi:hypothetical protein
MMQIVKHFTSSGVNILLLFSVVLMYHALISISLAYSLLVNLHIFFSSIFMEYICIKYVMYALF